MILAAMTVGAAWLAPLKGSRLLLLAMGQLILLAGVGHAAMNDGPMGALQRLNYAFHLICAATWLGGLLPCCSACVWRKGAGRMPPSLP
jgi:putative copper resistance protein D